VEQERIEKKYQHLKELYPDEFAQFYEEELAKPSPARGCVIQKPRVVLRWGRGGSVLQPHGDSGLEYVPLSI
jgi:hypothetical protein